MHRDPSQRTTGLLVFFAVLILSAAALCACTEKDAPDPKAASVTSAPTAEASPPPAPTEEPTPDPEADKLYLDRCPDYDEVNENDEPLSFAWLPGGEMFIYGGTEYYRCLTLDPLTDLVGEKLGEAEWIDIVYTETSGEEEAFDRPWISISENELRGSVRGSVFAAKGFDPGVMLCMRDPYSAGVSVFMCDCGITDKNGEALIEGVFHVSERLRSAAYTHYETVEESTTCYKGTIAPDADEVKRFLEKLDSAEWVNDTRSSGSRYYDESDAERFWGSASSVCAFTLELDGGFGLDLTVYRDGMVCFPGSFCGRALRIDHADAAPLIGLINQNKGESRVYGDAEILAEYTGARFLGDAVPRMIPEGYHIRNTSIRYLSDPDTGELIGAEHIRLEYAEPDQAGLIWLWIRPTAQKDAYEDVKYAVEHGARIADAGEFDESCMYVKARKSEGEPTEYYSESVAEYNNAVIYVQAFETQPRVIVELIRSIGG